MPAKKPTPVSNADDLRKVTVLTNDVGMAVECQRLLGALAGGHAVEVHDAPMAVLLERLANSHVALCLREAPSESDLLAATSILRSSGRTPGLCVLGNDDDDRTGFAADLGWAVVREIRPLVALTELLPFAAQKPWAASVRGLSELDRERVEMTTTSRDRTPGLRLLTLDGGEVALHEQEREPVRLGEARDVAVALIALERASLAGPQSRSQVDDVNQNTVGEILFGPRRALSDPASKAVLREYGVTVPLEEVCGSPSRAAAEAMRIGFPVRIALASPDLRLWNQPELAIDGVETAGRVKELFRQLTSLAEERKKDARILGVTVSAALPVDAQLDVHLSEVGRGVVRARIGFSDPHGVASGDSITTPIPCTPGRLEHALKRLRGAKLLLSGTPHERKERLAHLSDTLNRLAALVADQARFIEAIEIRPLALLVTGRTECREVCIHVSDGFLRAIPA